MKSVKSIGLYILAAGLIFMLAFVRQSNGLKAKEFAQKIKATSGAQIIDVRTPEEFSTGYIIGAVNIDWNNDNFDRRITKVDKNKPTFVYCRSGRRSADAAKVMRDMGFKEVYELSGGIQSWESAGLPVKK
jgi:rhodanese-related sulfurtransferase